MAKKEKRKYIVHVHFTDGWDITTSAMGKNPVEAAKNAGARMKKLYKNKQIETFSLYPASAMHKFPVRKKK